MKHQLTENDYITLGRADESFRMHDADQGIHILLPCWTDMSKTSTVNDQFKPLFEEHFNKIPAWQDLNERQRRLIRVDDGNDGYCELYCGAIERWLQDLGVFVEPQWRSHYTHFMANK